VVLVVVLVGLLQQAQALLVKVIVVVLVQVAEAVRVLLAQQEALLAMVQMVAQD
jgi:hypothetical protein